MVILITIGVLYNHAIPAIFEIERIVYGGAIYPVDFKDQIEFFLKIQFSIIVLFWTSLWAVKFSFLMFYRKILAGLPGYMIWWNLVFIFTVLAYLSCQLSNLKSCTPISNYFHLGTRTCDIGVCRILTVQGACDSKQNRYFQNLNLYFSTVVDVISDVLSKSHFLFFL